MLEIGYHTSTCADDKLIVLGGSDGSQSFSSIDVLDLKTNVWHRLDRTLDNAPVSRAFHSTVLVGNSLFAVGGHDGKSYAKDILAFDFRPFLFPLSFALNVVGCRLADILVRLVHVPSAGRRTWSTKKVGGKLPTPERGYHSSTYADGRIFIFGGSDGSAILGDLWIVELGSLGLSSHMRSTDRKPATLRQTKLTNSPLCPLPFDVEAVLGLESTVSLDFD